MKPVQSSVSDVAGDLLPSFVAKGDGAVGESFQAALALALQSVVQIVPAAPQSKIPLPIAEPAKSADQPSSAEPAVAKTEAPPAGTKKGAIEKADPPEGTAAPTPPPPAEVIAIVARPLVPSVSAVEQGDTHDKGDAPPESKLRAPQSPRAVKPAAVALPARPVPVAEPRQPARPVEPPVPHPRTESSPAARAEPVPVVERVRVTVEEIGIEAKAPVAPPPVKDRKLQRDVEAVQYIAESSAGAPHPDGVPAQPQRASHERTPGAPDAAAQLRHFDEAPANPGTMDRVTLHLPDDAGGGRIQIAVRGDVVHARIVSADEVGAMEMQSGLDELRGALTRQGFQETHVRVETRPASDAGWMPASAAREASGAGDSRPHDSERQERQTRDQRQSEEHGSDQRRQQADGRPHQRSRRERER